MRDAGYSMLDKWGQSPAVLKKKRVRAHAEKSLESATKCAKVDAGRAARKKFSLVRFRLTVERFRMSYR
jgi:hypothetical protein